MSRIVDTQLPRHAQNLAFLWGMRRTTATAPYGNLASLDELDNRLSVHLAALTEAGDSGWKACGPPPGWLPGEAFGAALLAFYTGESTRTRTVLDTAVAVPELVEAVVSALAWLPYGDIRQHVRDLLQAESPALRRLGMAACTAQREEPGQALDNALNDADAALRACGLRAVGELGFAALQPALEAHLDDPDDTCRFEAAWSLTVLGSSKGIPVLGGFAAEGGERGEQSCAVALRRLRLVDAYAAQKELLHAARQPRLAVIAAGIIGDPAFADWLIGLMEDPMLGRAAGESFSRITGADLAHDDLDGEPPVQLRRTRPSAESDVPPPPDPDDGYLWPNADAVADWWAGGRRDLLPGSRYLLGQPVTRDWLKTILRSGRQPHRASAALELAVSFPGQPLFDVSARAVKQEMLLRQDNLGRRARRIEPQ